MGFFPQSWQLEIELLIVSQFYCQKYLLSVTSFLVNYRGVIDNIKKGAFLSLYEFKIPFRSLSQFFVHCGKY